MEAEDKEVSITSSDTNVVVVSADGNVKPVGNGTCTVRVQCVDYPDVYTEIPVTVNAPIFDNTLAQSVGKTVAKTVSNVLLQFSPKKDTIPMYFVFQQSEKSKTGGEKC